MIMLISVFLCLAQREKVWPKMLSVSHLLKGDTNGAQHWYCLTLLLCYPGVLNLVSHRRACKREQDVTLLRQEDRVRTTLL